jgi:hypothetical protein
MKRSFLILSRGAPDRHRKVMAATPHSGFTRHKGDPCEGRSQSIQNMATSVSTTKIHDLYIDAAASSSCCWPVDQTAASLARLAQSAPNASAMAIKGRQLSAWRSRNGAGIGGSEASSASLAQPSIMR